MECKSSFYHYEYGKKFSILIYPAQCTQNSNTTLCQRLQWYFIFGVHLELNWKQTTRTNWMCSMPQKYLIPHQFEQSICFYRGYFMIFQGKKDHTDRRSLKLVLLAQLHDWLFDELKQQILWRCVKWISISVCIFIFLKLWNSFLCILPNKPFCQ